MWETQIRQQSASVRPAVAVPATEADVDPGRPPGPRGWQWWFPLVAFALIGGTMVAVSVLAHGHLPLLHRRHRTLQGSRWIHAFSWWDGWWYVGIARRGYLFFRPERQSPVAFFPLYPMLIRWIGRRTGGLLLAAFLVTLASSLGAAVLFHRWCHERFGSHRARLALLLLLLYPFSFYLMGAMYADALFLFTALAAFVALEHDQPILAGVAAALATAARPVGVAVVVGLWVLALERKGVWGPSVRRRVGWPEVRSRFRPADAGLLLAPAGLVAFCVFLWIRFDRPFAFLDTAGAPGWDQPPGFHTWFKIHWIKAMAHGPWTNGHFGHLLINSLATFAMCALIPSVFRRLGWGYGIFVVVAVVATAISTKDFVGMGRYSIAAFPCFAVAAELLARRPRLAAATLGVSAFGLLMLGQLHARGTIIS